MANCAGFLKLLYSFFSPDGIYCCGPPLCILNEYSKYVIYICAQRIHTPNKYYVYKTLFFDEYRNFQKILGLYLWNLLDYYTKIHCLKRLLLETINRIFYKLWKLLLKNNVKLRLIIPSIVLIYLYSNTFTCELPAWTDTMLGSKNNVFSKKAQ